MVHEANTGDLVSLGKFKSGGYAWVAPKGTPLPTDAATALDGAYKLLGYLSEDGITVSVDTDTSEVKDANGNTVLKIVSSYAETYQFTLLEVMRAQAAQLRYGAANVSGEDAKMTIKHAMPSDTPFVLVFEMVMTGGVKTRLVIGQATISEIGDRQIHAGDPQGYEITVSALDMDGQGTTAIEYMGTQKA